MSWLTRLGNLFRSNDLSREIDAEVATHLAERTDDLVAGGMSPAEAAAEARRRFGNRLHQHEAVREVDSLAWLESVLADIRYGMRALRLSPGFTAIAILSLALGIGANTAIFSLINSLALRTLPVLHPEQLVLVNTGGNSGEIFTNPLWEQIRDQQQIFSGALAYGGTSYNLAKGGVVDEAPASVVSGSYFPVLGVRAAAGRLIQPADDIRGCAGLAVVSAGFAERRLGGIAAAVGQMLSLDGQPFQVIGVTDPAFSGVEVGRRVDVYTPICSQMLTARQPDILEQRSRWYLSILARPRSGLSLAEVRSRIGVAARGIYEATTPGNWSADSKRNYLAKKLDVAPAAAGQSEFREMYRKALLVLMVVSGVVLLIACANIANLLLARAATRQREMAIRLAIGAGRLRLVRQLLTESLLLSLAGVALGVLFAQWAARLLVQFLSTDDGSVWLDLSPDVRVLGFTIAVAVLTGLLFGLAPAWRASRVDPQESMKSGGRGPSSDARYRLGKGLVAGQVALSLVLIASAGLLLGSFRKLTTTDLGFHREGVKLVQFDFGAGGFKDAQLVTQPVEVLRRLREVPGVQTASASLITPISHVGWNNFVSIPGYAPTSRRDSLANFNQVSDGYFVAMGSRLLAGRDITPADISARHNVAVINVRMASKMFGTTAPIGRTFEVVDHDTMPTSYEVVGMVEDAKYRAVDEVIPPTIFLPLGVGGQVSPQLNFEIRSSRPLADLMPEVKRIADESSPGISLQATTLTDQVASTLKRPRLLAVLSGFFGALALLLAMIGLYGTIAYTVARRRNEIGIRMALGASCEQVVMMVVSDAGRVVLVGIGVGVVLTFVSTRLLTSFLYGMSATDPAILIGSALALAITALGAASIPAFRAVRLSPTEAIRQD